MVWEQGCGGQGESAGRDEAQQGLHCYGCLRSLEDGAESQGVIVQCPDCKYLFCFDCDTYVHETLHNCPGCECMAPG